MVIPAWWHEEKYWKHDFKIKCCERPGIIKYSRGRGWKKKWLKTYLVDVIVIGCVNCHHTVVVYEKI